ncbi:LCP family protein [Virgibacillus soli]|uniref:LCP family protein n=1 Tax=Paracerasibacillus soli TaxID=480284 RepID=A0ABU5CRV0_9BACI|nr:LCP family protein [Virgibacillus soli]MDY0409098.1 LCP family protein [Virgibacillus soli]
MGKGSKKKRSWWKISLVVILVIVLGIGGYGYSIYHNAKKTVNEKMHEPVNSIDTDLAKKKVKASKPINVLLLGIDARPGERGRSDALMVMSLDPKNDRMQIISIPRDTRTLIVGKGKEDKINHAYAFGGSDMAVATVENFLDIELDYYVNLNMEGLKELVDELGNITVDNEIEWTDGKYEFTKGPLAMDGDKTLSFVRMRKQDPAGDFGRTKRQRQVIEAIINRGASVGSIPKINSTIKILGKNMATSMDFDDMKDLFNNYRSTRHNVDNYMLQGTGTKINGIYYLIIPDEEVEKVHGMIAEIKS